MCRVDDEHRVELEADGARLDVPHAGEQQRGQDLAIAQPAPDAGGDLFEHPLAGRVLDEPYQRLDLRREADEPGIDSSVDR